MMHLKPQSGCAFKLNKGQCLTVSDPQGQQVADLFCFDANDVRNSFSASRTIDYADTIYVTLGHQLYSNRSDVLFTMIKDTCGRHDLLMSPCSLRMFQIVAGDDKHYPSCHENLAKALQFFDISPDQIGTTFNIFMNVTVEPDGSVQIRTPLSKPKDFVTLRAERDLIVGLTACSHEQSNGGRCKPVDYFID